MKTDIYKVAVGDVIYYRLQECFGEVLAIPPESKAGFINIQWSNEDTPTYGRYDCFAEEDFADNYVILENEKEKFEFVLRLKEF